MVIYFQSLVGIAHYWCYRLDILVFCPDFSDDTKIIYHWLGVIDIFSISCGILGVFWNRWLFRVSDLFQKI